MKTKIFQSMYLRVALVAALVLILAGCYATLGKESDGNLAVNASLPGVEAPDGTPLVARIYVATLDYEDLVRQFLAYEDFLDENATPSTWIGYYNDLETERDNIEIDLALKSVVKFGGKPYVDVEIIQTPSDDGSFTITGIPAGKEYTAYIQVFASGQQDNEDADPLYDSDLFTSSPTPYQEMFTTGAPADGTAEGLVAGTASSAVAQAAFEDVLQAYRDTETYPVVSVLVKEGETSTLNITVTNF